MEGELLCLKWRDHSSSLLRTLSSVRKKELYCDATIACNGRFYPVHKFVLSTCSDYFEQMFEAGKANSLMIVLTDIGCEELETLLDYMYFGEVNVLQSDLNTFMKAAERLRIKGLAEPSKPNYTEDCSEKLTRTHYENCQATKQKNVCNEIFPDSEHYQNVPNTQTIQSQEKTADTCMDSVDTDLDSERKEQESFSEDPITTVLMPTELESNISETVADKELRTGTQIAEIKLEPFIKPEPEDWHAEVTEDSNVFTSESRIPYLSPTSISVDTPVVDGGKERGNVHQQSNDFSGPSQLLPGPSGLHSIPPWDHRRPSGALTEEYVPYRGRISYGNMSHRKTGRPTSDIWNHYKTEKRDGKNFVICIYCSTQKYGYPNATKMKIHTVKCIKCPDKIRKQYKEDLAQTVAKSEAIKSHAMKQIPSLESQRS